MSKAVNRAQVFQTTKVRSALKGDGSWIRRASEEEEKPRKPELPRKPVVSPTTDSPVASPTAVDPQTPEAKQTGSATETRPPLLRQSSYVLSTAMKFESVSTPESPPFKKVPLSAKRFEAAPESTTDPTGVISSEQVSLPEQPEKPVDKTAEETKEESVDSSVDQPETEPAETSAGAPGPPEAPELVVELEVESTEEPTVEPAATEPEEESVEENGEAVVEPALDTAVEQTVETVVEAAMDSSAVDTEAAPVTESPSQDAAVVEDVTEPVLEPLAAPVDVPAAEPAAESTAEAASEPVVESLVEPPPEFTNIDAPEVVQELSTSPVVDTELPAETADVDTTAEPEEEPTVIPIDQANTQPTETTTEATELEPAGDTGAEAMVDGGVESAIEAVLEQVNEAAPEIATEAVVQECESVPEDSNVEVAAVEPIVEATVEAQSVECAIELEEALDVEVSTPETAAEPMEPAEESLSVELPVSEQSAITNTEPAPEMIQTPVVDLQSVRTLRETEEGQAICSYCDGTIDGHIKITINHPPAYCHPDCFKCGVCSKFLGDMLSTMFLHGQVIHCDSCFAKTL